MDIIFSLGSPLLFFIITFIFSDKLMSSRKYDKKTQSSFSRKLMGTFLITAGILVISCIVSGSFMFHDDDGVPVSVLLLAGALPFAAAMVREFTTYKRTALFLKRSAIAVLAVFSAEVLLFNAKSFDRKPESRYIDLRTISAPMEAVTDNGELYLSGNTSLYFSDLPQYTRALIIDQERVDTEHADPFMAVIGVQDDNVSTDYETMRQRMISSQESEFAMSFTPYGNIRDVRLYISDVFSPVVIHSVRAVSSVPFHFSLIRFSVVTGIVLLICLILSFSLWKVTYQRRRISHRLIVGGMVLLCVSSSFIFMRPNEKAYEFDTENVSTADPYAATLDAFEKGQLHLDVEVSPELMEMEDPYNRSLRDSTGVPYVWDMTYYDGHYYSYFGVAPVLLYYAPYYKITGKMPTMGMAQPIFGAIAIFAFCMTILAAVKLLVPRPNLLLLICIMPVSVCVSGIVYSINYTNIYVLPTICGLCFLFLTLWTGLSACSCKKKTLRILLLIVSGTSLALCAASRPSIALSSVVLIPFFIGILRNKNMKIGFRLSQAAAFMIPLLIGGAALMWYNNARFGSPFEFGAKYQLTVSNVDANKLHFAGIAPMLYHFVFLRPRPRGFFPFIEPNFCSLFNYGRMTYTADSVGLFTYPLFILGMAMIPAAIQRRGRSFANSSSKLQRNVFLILCFTVPFIIGWQSYCFGGVNQRYVIDMTPLILIGAVICILRGASSAVKNRYRYITAHVCLAVTFAVYGLMTVSDRYGNLIQRHPAVNDICEDLLIFWQ